MSKKSDAAKQIIPEAMERHFLGLVDQAILWLGAERVLAHVETSRRKDAA